MTYKQTSAALSLDGEESDDDTITVKIYVPPPSSLEEANGLVSGSTTSIEASSVTMMEEIGAGGFGQVFKGIYKPGNDAKPRIVALKTVVVLNIIA